MVNSWVSLCRSRRPHGLLRDLQAVPHTLHHASAWYCNTLVMHEHHLVSSQNMGIGVLGKENGRGRTRVGPVDGMDRRSANLACHQDRRIMASSTASSVPLFLCITTSAGILTLLHAMSHSRRTWRASWREERAAPQHVPALVPPACPREKSITLTAAVELDMATLEHGVAQFLAPPLDTGLHRRDRNPCLRAASTWDLPPRSVARSASRDSGSRCMTRGRMHAASAPLRGLEGVCGLSGQRLGQRDVCASDDGNGQ